MKRIYNSRRSIQKLTNTKKNRLSRMLTTAILFMLLLLQVIHAITYVETIEWDNLNLISSPQNVPQVTPTPLYNPDDIVVINNIIDANKLKWLPTMPVDGTYVDPNWTGVLWSEDETNKRIITLMIEDLSLEGTLDVSGLAHLKWLTCNDNALTSINISGLLNLVYLNCADNSIEHLDISNLANLKTLMCHNNNLESLDVSNCTQIESLYCQNNLLASFKINDLENLEHLNCSGNSLMSLKLNEKAPYQYINVSDNDMEYESDIIGQMIDWDAIDFIFSPQNTPSGNLAPPTPHAPPTPQFEIP